MPKYKKIESVLQLARYQVGDVAWWATLRPLVMVPSVYELPEGDEWIAEHHPKALFDRGYHKPLWKNFSGLPKLQHIDFQCIMELLTSKLVIEEFRINDIVRSRNTGEFFYSNENDEWMPESYLLDTKQAANRERLRILKMLRKWATE